MFLFTKPYISYHQVMVVNESNSSIHTQKDLAGKKVAVQIGTTAQEVAETLQKEISFDLFTYELTNELILKLKNNEVDAVICDEFIARYNSKMESINYKVVGEKFSEEKIGICFLKSNIKLKEQVDKVLDDMRNDGTLKEISIKWFGADLTNSSAE
jgi:polar amino acid transport system substrate-binding protein